RARRNGKSHQGAIEPVRGPHEHGGAAVQSVAAVLLLAGLCAGLGLAAVGVGRHGIGGSASRHHPAAAAKTRRAGAHHRAPHLGPFQSRLSLAERLCRRLHGPALLKKPDSYRTRTSNQNRGPALHVKCAQKSLPVCQGGRSAFQKIRCIAPAAKTSRLPTIPQPQSRTREKSGLVLSVRLIFSESNTNPDSQS